MRAVVWRTTPRPLLGLAAWRSALRENRRLPRAQESFALTTHEPAELLCGVTAAQRLQGRHCLRDCRVAVAASGVDLVSDFRSAAVDDESFRRSDCARFSDCTDSCLGI